MNENNKEGEPLPQPIEVLWVDNRALTTLATHKELFEKIIDGKNKFVLSARKALGILEELAKKGQLPDIVVSDFRMPRMNGLEFAREVKNHSNPQIRSLPFCVFTGFTPSSDREELNRLGVSVLDKDLLPKEASKIRQIYESNK